MIIESEKDDELTIDPKQAFDYAEICVDNQNKVRPVILAEVRFEDEYKTLFGQQ